MDGLQLNRGSGVEGQPGQRTLDCGWRLSPFPYCYSLGSMLVALWVGVRSKVVAVWK